ncbi:MAG: DUF3179 domain-containing protein [Alphaproteobacteria bacterium]|nr:DUF3179 domain-containing protein [Alphaproteobacteria bacterium]
MRVIIFITMLLSYSVPIEAIAQISEQQLINNYRALGIWRTDFNTRSIDLREIIDGGPGKDGIPAISYPVFEPVQNVSNIGIFEPLITISINGDARGYPFRMLIWHEIVNDVVGGVPVAITYCPLCNSAIVFDRRTNTEILQFGVSGLLRHSDMIMYDKQTHSWWQQFTGEAVVGTLNGFKLKIITARTESFQLFKTRFPDGKILVPTNPYDRAYGQNPYLSYDTSNNPFFYKGDYQGDLPALAHVVVVEDKAWALKTLRDIGEIIDGDVIIRWTSGQNSALDTAIISKGRDIGNITAQKNGKDIPYITTFAFAYDAFVKQKK